MLIVKKFFQFSELKKGIPLTIPFIPEIIESSDFYDLTIKDYSNILFGKTAKIILEQNYLIRQTFLLKIIKSRLIIEKE